jgi:thioredoxin reductase (NADPH)
MLAQDKGLVNDVRSRYNMQEGDSVLLPGVLPCIQGGEPRSLSLGGIIMEPRKLIVIGSGPAALTAAVYAGRASLSPLVISGRDLGGSVALTERVDNYPGFPDGVGGFELAQRMQKQAERFGAEILMDEVVSVDLSKRPFEVRTHGATYSGRALVIATGRSPRKLGVPGESEFAGRGVSSCATCDGYFYRDQRVVVVGGGDTAVKEALFLTKFASEVVVVHRRDSLRAERVVEDMAADNEKIRFVWDSLVTEILGEEGVEGVRLESVKTGEVSTLEAQGVFVFVGNTPNTELFRGQLQLDEAGYVVTDERQKTSVEGVFAAGDVQEAIAWQVATAVGSGARAAMQADEYLAEMEGRAHPEREW